QSREVPYRVLPARRAGAPTGGGVLLRRTWRWRSHLVAREFHSRAVRATMPASPRHAIIQMFAQETEALKKRFRAWKDSLRRYRQCSTCRLSAASGAIMG